VSQPRGVFLSFIWLGMLRGMEDGPGFAEGTYDYAGTLYRLDEHESERWRVYDGNTYLGQVVAVKGTQEAGPLYTSDFAGEEDVYDEPATDDWRLVLEYLIDNSAPRVGA
jgi:hypothetical protein